MCLSSTSSPKRKIFLLNLDWPNPSKERPWASEMNLNQWKPKFAEKFFQGTSPTFANWPNGPANIDERMITELSISNLSRSFLFLWPYLHRPGQNESNNETKIWGTGPQNPYCCGIARAIRVSKLCVQGHGGQIGARSGTEYWWLSRRLLFSLWIFCWRHWTFNKRVSCTVPGEACPPNLKIHRQKN